MAEAITIPSPSVFLAAMPVEVPKESTAEASPADLPAPAVRPTSREKGLSSIEAKKKAHRRSGSGGATLPIGAGGPGDVNGVKPKQSKSRNGCVTCKAKRLKCGEEKPGCQQCARRNVECGGYKKDFKWRPFEETNVKINIDRQQKAAQQPVTATGAAPVTTAKPPPTVPAAPAAVSKTLSPVTKDGVTAKRPPPPPRTNTSEEGRRDTKRSSPDQDSADDRIPSDLPRRPVKATRKRRDPSPDMKPTLPIKDLPEPAPPPMGLQMTMPLREASARPSHALGQRLLDSQSPVLSEPNLSPTLTDILLPFSDGESTPSEAFINFSLPDGMQYPLGGPSMLDPVLTHIDGIDSLASIERSIEGPSRMPIFHNPRTPRRNRHSSSSISPRPDSAIGSFSGPVHYLYTQPFFAQDSPEMLSFRFDRLTCGILSIMDGPTENPWRTLVWPLAQQSPALYNAVIAMTAFHSARDVPSLRVVGHEHKQASIRYISEGIRDSSMTDQMAIATALALGFSESWDQHTVTGNTHIKGAQALVKRAMESHQREPLQGVELSRLKFLCNAWVFMDVLARLTSFDSDESHDFDNTFLFAPNAPQMVMGDSGHMGFGIDFGMPIDARLDPLMGCANTLFPLIGRVANLVRRVCRSHSNSPAIISQANDLKLALETWDPPEFIETPEDPTTEVQHTLQTAEAYRWATLLHLHQSVPELPSLTTADLAQRVLQYLATVPLVSRTVVVQIYPLMVAGCEASTTEDRQWVRERWEAMLQRMRIGVIEKCATVVEEVWRRKDAYEAQPSARRRLVATAELQTARQRGQPLVRTDDGYQDSDPGRTGMVFSYVETDGDVGKPEDKRPNRPNRQDRNIGHMDAAYTVRGHLHWVGVMWDWGWEGEWTSGPDRLFGRNAKLTGEPVLLK